MKKFWKNNKGLIIGIGAVILLVLFTILQDNSKEEKVIEIDESLLSAEMSDWLNSTREDKYVVTVIGMTTCPHCQNYKPVITSVSDNENLNLYFFEADTITNAEDNNALENAYELENYEGSVPYTFVTKNGEFVCDTVGGMDEKGTNDFLRSCGVIE